MIQKEKLVQELGKLIELERGLVPLLNRHLSSAFSFSQFSALDQSRLKGFLQKQTRAQTKTVDRVVMDLVDGEDFNFALITPGNSDHAYRYFLELWGKKPKVIYNPQIDPDRKSVTGQLIVICEGPCAPLGNPAWEVAGFGRAEIVQEKVGPAGIKIFKLVHYIK